MQLQDMPIEYFVSHDSQDIAEVLNSVGDAIPKNKHEQVTGIAVKAFDGVYVGVYYTTEDNPWLVSTKYTKVKL